MSEMKLYAVVIGRKDGNTRYIAYEPFSGGDNQNGRLAIYENRERAKEAKWELLRTCQQHDGDVFVVGFPIDL